MRSLPMPIAWSVGIHTCVMCVFNIQVLDATGPCTMTYGELFASANS